MPLPEQATTTEAPFAREDAKPLCALLTPVLREHFLVAAVIALHALAAFAVADIYALEGAVRISLYGEGMLLLLTAAATGFFVAWLLRIIVLKRPSRPFGYALQEAKQFEWKRRLVAGVPSLLLLAVLMSVYSSWKVMIPALNPFSWDPVFHLWDLYLHGGRLPWEWLQTPLGYPLITLSINAIYHLWLFVIYFVFLWQAFSLANPVLRTQFMLCFALLWALLGNVLATILSSAGPCYFGNVVGDPAPYAELFRYLHAVDMTYPVWALDVQANLWADYRSGELGVGRGISAMPSLHVATALLVFLLSLRYGRAAAVAGGLFALSILIGSVHLGWHYAVDGYLSIVLTPVLWVLCGQLSRYWHRATA